MYKKIAYTLKKIKFLSVKILKIMNFVGLDLT